METIIACQLIFLQIVAPISWQELTLFGLNFDRWLFSSKISCFFWHSFRNVLGVFSKFWIFRTETLLEGGGGARGLKSPRNFQVLEKRTEKINVKNQTFIDTSPSGMKILMDFINTYRYHRDLWVLFARKMRIFQIVTTLFDSLYYKQYFPSVLVVCIS